MFISFVGCVNVADGTCGAGLVWRGTHTGVTDQTQRQGKGVRTGVQNRPVKDVQPHVAVPLGLAVVCMVTQKGVLLSRGGRWIHHPSADLNIVAALPETLYAYSPGVEVVVYVVELRDQVHVVAQVPWLDGDGVALVAAVDGLRLGRPVVVAGHVEVEGDEEPECGEVDVHEDGVRAEEFVAEADLGDGHHPRQRLHQEHLPRLLRVCAGVGVRRQGRAIG